jgi:hypothetical protein
MCDLEMEEVNVNHNMTSSTTTTPFPSHAVIRKLALKAETDPKLEAVLKSVAAGQATKEQLESFQARSNQ